jgi:hypothetical protein
MADNLPGFKTNFFPNGQILYHLFPYIAKNIEGSLYLSTFVSGFYSQIWLNVLLQDDYHFGNFTNTKTKQHIQRVFVKRLALNLPDFEF